MIFLSNVWRTFLRRGCVFVQDKTEKEDIFFFFFQQHCCRYHGGCFLNCRSYVGAEFTKRQLACKITLPFCCPRFAFVVGTPLTRATDDVQLFKQTRSNLAMLRRIKLNEICTLEIMLPRSTWKVHSQFSYFIRNKNYLMVRFFSLSFSKLLLFKILISILRNLQ